MFGAVCILARCLLSNHQKSWCSARVRFGRAPDPLAREFHSSRQPVRHSRKCSKLSSNSLSSSAYIIQPRASCFSLLRHAPCVARCFALANAGSNMAARMAMIAMTTRSSISVKPPGVLRRRRHCEAGIFMSTGSLLMHRIRTTLEISDFNLDASDALETMAKLSQFGYPSSVICRLSYFATARNSSQSVASGKRVWSQKPPIDLQIAAT
jgi:hypothetical protein